MFAKIFHENIILRKRNNKLQIKNIALNEELLNLYRNKSSLIDERDQYKESALKYKEEYKELKKTKAILETELAKSETNFHIQQMKNKKLIDQLKKYQDMGQKGKVKSI